MSICHIEGCGKTAVAHHLCMRHYRNAKRNNGNPIPNSPKIGGRKPCMVHGCTNRRDAWGLCDMHYHRLLNTGTVQERQYECRKTCSVEGCANPVRCRGLCNNHYQLQRNNGVPKTKRQLRAELQEA